MPNTTGSQNLDDSVLKKWTNGATMLKEFLQKSPAINRNYWFFPNSRSYRVPTQKEGISGLMRYATAFEGDMAGDFGKRELILDYCKIDHLWQPDVFLREMKALGIADFLNNDFFEGLPDFYMDSIFHAVARDFYKICWAGEKANNSAFLSMIDGFKKIFDGIAAGTYVDAYGAVIHPDCLLTGPDVGNLNSFVGGDGDVVEAIHNLVGTLSDEALETGSVVVEVSRQVFRKYKKDIESQNSGHLKKDVLEYIKEDAPIGNYYNEYLGYVTGSKVRPKITVGCKLDDPEYDNVSLVVNDGMTRDGADGYPHAIATVQANLGVYHSGSSTSEQGFRTVKQLRTTQLGGEFEAKCAVAMLGNREFAMHVSI